MNAYIAFTPRQSTRRLFQDVALAHRFTASHLNSSVCCQLLLRNTSIIAIGYGKRAVHEKLAGPITKISLLGDRTHALVLSTHKQRQS